MECGPMVETYRLHSILCLAIDELLDEDGTTEFERQGHDSYARFEMYLGSMYTPECQAYLDMCQLL